MTAVLPDLPQASEVRVSAENSRYENDKFHLRGTEMGRLPRSDPFGRRAKPTPLITYHNHQLKI